MEKGLPAIVRAHDIFNLIFIGLLNLQNLYYLTTGKGFNEFFTSTMLYFLADLVFVGVRPLSVKSPVIILAHHVSPSRRGIRGSDPIEPQFVQHVL